MLAAKQQEVLWQQSKVRTLGSKPRGCRFDSDLPYNMSKQYIEIGDTVIDVLDGCELKVVDIFTRDGVQLVECANGIGETTTVVPKYLRLKN